MRQPPCGLEVRHCDVPTRPYGNRVVDLREHDDFATISFFATVAKAAAQEILDAMQLHARFQALD